MEEHPTFNVYAHLPAFFRHRGLTAVDAARLAEERGDFVTAVNLTGYFRVDAADAAGRVTVMLLLAPGGKFTTSGPKLRDLVSALDSDAVADRLEEVIVVAPEAPTGKTNMKAAIATFRRRLAAAAADAAAGVADPDVTPPPRGRFYNMYPYYRFQVVVPEAQCVPEHTVMSAAAAAALLARMRCRPGALKKIFTTDAAAIWIGARAGQIVRIERASETAGKAYDYRHVVEPAGY